MITKETVLNKIDSGWHNTVELIYEVLPQLPFCSGVYMIERKNGMLSVIFSRTNLTNDTQEFILKCIEYKIERMTAKICEGCGQHGLRRVNLPEVKTLCTKCYAITFSEINSVPSLVANQKPQIV